MKRTKKLRVEIVPRSEAALVPRLPAESAQAMIERIVRERVDEIAAERGAGNLDPDFQSREVAVEIMRRQTVFERRRWAIYFERWGCRRCENKDVIHFANGYCNKCHQLLFSRLARIKRDYDKANTEQGIQKQIDHLTLRSRSAKGLVGSGDK